MTMRCVVLEDDIERDIFGLRLGRLRRRHVERDASPAASFFAGSRAGGAAQRHPPVLDQRLQSPARQMRRDDLRPLGEEAVEPRAGSPRPTMKSKRAAAASFCCRSLTIISVFFRLRARSC